MSIIHDNNGDENFDCMIADKPANFAEVFGWDAEGIKIAIGNDTGSASFNVPPALARVLTRELQRALAMIARERERADCRTA